MLLVGALGATVLTQYVGRRSQVPPPHAVRTWLGVEPAEAVGRKAPLTYSPVGVSTAFAWAPDGRALVYVGSRKDAVQLYVRPLDRDDARLLNGTDGAFAPAISPDGQWVAFYADHEIRKVPIAGGPRETVVTTPDDYATRIVWAGNGSLVYDSSAGIREWGTTGARMLTKTRIGEQDQLPSLLPGERVLLYTERHAAWTWGDEEVVALDLTTAARKVLLHDATDARYVPNGQLVFLRRGQLFAVPFDPTTIELKGTPVAVLDGVVQALSASNSGAVSGAGQFAVAPTGALAWLPGAPVEYPQASLAAVDRRGTTTALPAPARAISGGLRVSPDGHRLAFTVKRLTGMDLCVYDLARDTVTTVASKGEFDWPTWTPDGRQIIIQYTGLRRTLRLITADSGAATDILDGDFSPMSWAPGRRLAVLVDDQIRVLTLDEHDKPAPPASFDIGHPVNSAEFSPDGRLIAYTAEDAGTMQVYVQPYPGPGTRLQVSTRGGHNPAWNPKGGELFFLSEPASPPQRMMVVSIHATPTLTVSPPRPLFDLSGTALENGSCWPTRCYDVAPDGQHFFAVVYPASGTAPPATHINLVLNWLDEVKEKTAK
jgi:serine/threonine-protein kinase